MNTRKKAILNLLLTLVLTLGLFNPIGVIAQTTPEPQEEDGVPGVLILEERTFFTQEELREFIPPQEVRDEFSSMTDAQQFRNRVRVHAYYPLIPHLTQHPNRRMTSQELQLWIQAYEEMGGLSVFELEVLYLLNEIRVENGLEPYTLCPNLSMAARMQSQLTSQFGFWGHEDPFYGRPRDRVNLFDQSRTTILENATGGMIPSRSVSSWMNSPGHRALILSEAHSVIGIGRSAGGGVYMKTTTPAERVFQ